MTQRHNKQQKQQKIVIQLDDLPTNVKDYDKLPLEPLFGNKKTIKNIQRKDYKKGDSQFINHQQRYVKPRIKKYTEAEERRFQSRENKFNQYLTFQNKQKQDERQDKNERVYPQLRRKTKPHRKQFKIEQMKRNEKIEQKSSYWVDSDEDKNVNTSESFEQQSSRDITDISNILKPFQIEQEQQLVVDLSSIGGQEISLEESKQQLYSEEKIKEIVEQIVNNKSNSWRKINLEVKTQNIIFFKVKKISIDFLKREINLTENIDKKISQIIQVGCIEKDIPFVAPYEHKISFQPASIKIDEELYHQIKDQERVKKQEHDLSVVFKKKIDKKEKEGQYDSNFIRLKQIVMRCYNQQCRVLNRIDLGQSLDRVIEFGCKGCSEQLGVTIKTFSIEI